MRPSRNEILCLTLNLEQSKHLLESSIIGVESDQVENAIDVEDIMFDEILIGLDCRRGRGAAGEVKARAVWYTVRVY